MSRAQTWCVDIDLVWSVRCQLPAGHDGPHRHVELGGGVLVWGGRVRAQPREEEEEVS